jgi:hypothetical protein
MLSLYIRASLGILFAAVLASASQANDTALSKGDIVLTVSGDISLAGESDILTLDLNDLRGLPAKSFDTSTIWTDGVHTFTGVSLKSLAELIDVTEGTFRATAINDYTVEIPVSDAVVDGPIIAYLMDGEEMSVRDKGPLWIIYPYDRSANFRSEVIYLRSIWQLDRIEFVK